jgi:ABC-type transport system involved in multi-copper enzyme maturation permease subunit
MTAVVRAELAKLLRARVVAGATLAAAAFAVVAAITVFLAADPGPAPAAGRGVTLADLARPGGATVAFATGASFAGLFVFVTVVANVAGEFARGTFRTLLLRQPGRLRLLAGKTAALLLFAAGVTAAAEVLTAVASTVVAPARGVPTTEWFSADGLGRAAAHFGTAFSAVAGWALLATALGALARSVPVALGIGIAWAGPFEHLLQDAWAGASRWFPGLLLEALAVGGTPDVAQARAALLVGAYAAAATTWAALRFWRRDVLA